MSKKCKTAARLRRTQEKRARKASNKAQYEAWRDAGKNSKTARSASVAVSVRCNRNRKRTKLMSDKPARDGGFLTLRQAHNQGRVR